MKGRQEDILHIGNSTMGFKSSLILNGEVTQNLDMGMLVKHDSNDVSEIAEYIALQSSEVKRVIQTAL